VLIRCTVVLLLDHLNTDPILREPDHFSTSPDRVGVA
jgi:hypothetical protein